MSKTESTAQDWLLLVMTISGRHAASRMRVWRKLKLLGAGVLRDGVYVLPAKPDSRAGFSELAKEVVATGGTARLLQVHVHDAEFSALFDRTDEYRSLMQEITAAARTLKTTSAMQALRRSEQLRKELEVITGRDFFPSPLQAKTRTALDELKSHVERLVTPDEPRAAHVRIRRLDKSQYQARTWATRARPWVDRLTSAWLIKRFIDPKAKFRWLQNVKSRPNKRELAELVGFDFDGAAFTHVDGKVTFEVLAHSFGLEADPALQRVGAIVHYLDVGGLPLPEAASIELVLKGMQERAQGDDRFLAAACVLFDDLYAGYVQEASSQ